MHDNNAVAKGQWLAARAKRIFGGAKKQKQASDQSTGIGSHDTVHALMVTGTAGNSVSVTHVTRSGATHGAVNSWQFTRQHSTAAQLQGLNSKAHRMRCSVYRAANQELAVAAAKEALELCDSKVNFSPCKAVKSVFAPLRSGQPIQWHQLKKQNSKQKQASMFCSEFVGTYA